MHVLLMQYNLRTWTINLEYHQHQQVRAYGKNWGLHKVDYYIKKVHTHIKVNTKFMHMCSYRTRDSLTYMLHIIAFFLLLSSTIIVLNSLSSVSLLVPSSVILTSSLMVDSILFIKYTIIFLKLNLFRKSIIAIKVSKGNTKVATGEFEFSSNGSAAM